MKVVHLLPSTDDAGAENQARYLVKALHEGEPPLAVELAYFRRGRAHARFVELGIPLHDLQSRGPLALDARRRARRLVALSTPPAILHTWLYEANVVGAITVNRWPETQLVITQRSGTMMHHDRIRRGLTGLLRRRAGHALANSAEGVDLLTGAGFRHEQVSLVPNALPEDRIQTNRSPVAVRADLGLSEGDTAICVVGRADHTKDYPGLMKAMTELWRARPNVRLVLIGPTRDELAALGVVVPGHVQVLGWQEHPATLMAACNLVAIPSWTEGHSNVADEALMLGLPVVTTEAGDHPTLVVAAGGLSVPIRRPDALAHAMLELLARPPDPSEVRAVAEQALAIHHAADRTREIYQRLVETPSGRRP